MAERIYKEHLIRDFGINRGILDYLDRMEEKLGDSFERPKYIKTVWGVGYEMDA